MTQLDARLAPRGLFVTGTDTGVGKTLVACEIVRRLRARGEGVGVLKPVETGVGPEGPQDAKALREAAGVADAIDEICPQRFALPAAPSVAAAAEGRRVDLNRIDQALERVKLRHSCVIVEGAGGLLVPITPDFNMADLAHRLGLPVLVVCRAALGTLNHTWLTLEAARSRGLRVAGIVISHSAGSLSAADAANLDALRAEPGAPLLGEIPPLPAETSIPKAALDLDGILAALD